MTSYVYELKKCTNCDGEFISNSLRSGNTRGAVFYTDGYMFSPMYSEEVHIVKCPDCGSYLWKNSLSTIKYFSESEFIQYRGTDNLGGSYQPSIDFEHLLLTPIWKNLDQEKYIRIRAWWAYNNRYRPQEYQMEFPLWEKYCRESGLPIKSRDFSITLEQEKNLHRILELLELQNQNDRLMMAEIHRELGDFTLSISLLDFDFSDDFKGYARVIVNLCNKQVSKVEIIN